MIAAFVAFLTGALAFGTFGFWVAVIIAAGLIVACLHWENGKGATVTMLVTVSLFLHFNTGLLVAFNYVKEHWLAFPICVLLYAALGAGWSVYKWRRLNSKHWGEKYGDLKRAFLKEHGAAELTTELKAQWERELASRKYTFDRNGQPMALDPYDLMDTIFMWMGHWPFSMLETFLDDPFRQILRFMYDQLVGTYLAIAQKAVGNVRGDFLTNEERAALAGTALQPGETRNPGRDDRSGRGRY